MGENMKFVYTLSKYREDGAIEVTATLDRSYLLTALRNNWTRWEKESKEDYEEQISFWNDCLMGILQRSDEELVKKDGWDLDDDVWGGIQLHVVKLVGG